MMTNKHYVCGIHSVLALLRNPHRKIYGLHVVENRMDHRFEALLLQAAERAIPLSYLSTRAMKQQFPDLIHQGIVATASPLVAYAESDLLSLLDAVKGPAFILILDGVTDPHNLGACLRSADAAGVHFVIAPKDKSADITAVVSKVASGAAENVPFVRVTNLARSMETLKEAGVWIYGATDDATRNLYQLDCCGSIALVMGAEGSGMRRLTRDHCDVTYALPMLGTVSSLNVSVAAGISMYEVVRQRRQSL